MKSARNSGLSFYLMMTAGLVATSMAQADMEVAPRATANGGETRPTKRWAQGERFDGEPAGERLIDRLLANPKLTSEIGLGDDTVAKLHEETRAIQARQIDLDAQIRKLSLDQADRMSKLLLASDANTNDIMKTVEDIGRLRTEQAKLAVQTLLVVRKYLTPEQIGKARELMRERMKKDADNRGEKAEARAAKKDKPVTAPAGPLPPKPPEGW